jgi:hypothetical protein
MRWTTFRSLEPVRGAPPRGAVPPHRSLPFGAACLAAALSLLAGGCVTTTVIQTNGVTAEVSSEEVPEAQLLDVGITVFDPGLPDPDSEKSPDPFVSDDVRTAESRYVPFQLRETLQYTRHWGAVRVIPGPSNSVDVTVSGEILHSDGERLALRVRAVDATGRVWFEREYDELAGQLSYRESLAYRDDEPFQDLYNRIANDLAEALDGLTGDERLAVRRVAEMRFAGDLAPEAFGDYVARTDAGRYELRRLPAYSDPMVQRMRRVREREYLFFDTLDEYYETFAGRMEVPYSEWRKYTYDEVITLRELKREALAHKLIGGAMIAGGLFSNSDSALGGLAEWTAIAAGIGAVKVGIDKGRQTKLQVATLEELNKSFEAEVEPMVMEIEGQTVTLQGTLERQFGEWRDILRDIYSLETGEVVSSTGGAAPAAAPGPPVGNPEAAPATGDGDSKDVSPDGVR